MAVKIKISFCQLLQEVENGETNGLKTVRKLLKRGVITVDMWNKKVSRRLLTAIFNAKDLPENEHFVYLRFLVDYYSKDEKLNKKRLCKKLGKVEQLLSKRETFPRIVHLILDMMRKDYPVPNYVFQSIIDHFCSFLNDMSFKTKLCALRAIYEGMKKQAGARWGNPDSEEEKIIGHEKFTEIILSELRTPLSMETYHLHEAVLIVTRYITEPDVVTNFIAPEILCYLKKCDDPGLLDHAIHIVYFSCSRRQDARQIYASQFEYWNTILQLCHHRSIMVAEFSREIVPEMCELLPNLPNISGQLKHVVLEAYRLLWAIDPQDTLLMQFLLELAQEKEELRVHMRGHNMDVLVMQMLQKHWRDHPQTVDAARQFLDLVQVELDAVDYEVAYPKDIY